MNPDLQKERNTCSFDTENLAYILDGGEYFTKRRREVEEMALKEKVFTEGPDYNFLSRPEKYDRGVKKAMLYIKKIKELNLMAPADAYWYRNVVFPNEAPPHGLHFAMFIPALQAQGTNDQKQRWLHRAEQYHLIGTYAQTELGHGTHLRGVETTATYDPKTEEFVLHSPTLTSLKWWPGGLGKTSNYVILMATTYTKGQNCGLQPFIVQIRDEETHEPLPGITVGDIGPKLAYDMIDNGFLGFEHVRIPRDHMLMKNAQILKDGTFVKSSKHEKLSYGTMVFVRSMIVSDISARGLAQAVTIATRYSCVRRQSELKPGAPEPQVIDYQTQQYKLFPLIATAYAFWFAGKQMRDIYFSINYEIQQGNTDLLPELHALSSGLKAFTTEIAMFSIEACRLACGGHGYSMASGIPKIYGNCTPACTYEGENTVLLLQTARFLLKAYSSSVSGGHLAPTMSYLTTPTRSRSSIDRNLDLETLVTDFKHRAKILVNKVGKKYTQLLSRGHPDWEARNICSIDLVTASKAHVLQWIVDNFVQQLQKNEGTSAVQKVLSTLCQLYGAYNICQNSGDFYEDGYMSASQVSVVQDRMFDLLQEVRPNAVGLVDAFDFRDHLLCSVLGRYDGNVYENLYKWAQSSPLNQKEVDDSFHKYIKPFRQELKAQSKL